MLNPMFFIYPEDVNTFPLQYQYFYGDSILVAPVTEEDSTTATIYLPDDIFYDYYTLTPIRGNGSMFTINSIPYTIIPLFIRGGSIIPTRLGPANTTTELRTKDFGLDIAPGLDGKARGSLYLDDGESLVQNRTSEIKFHYENGTFSMSGTFDFDVGNVAIARLTLLGVGQDKQVVTGDSMEWSEVHWKQRREGQRRGLVFEDRVPLTGPHSIKLV